MTEINLFSFASINIFIKLYVITSHSLNEVESEKVNARKIQNSQNPYIIIMVIMISINSTY
jgi:hypothetical protein